MVHERCAHGSKITLIDREHSNRHLPDRGSRNQFRTGPLKVVFPDVSARMEQSDDLSGRGVNSGYVWALVPIAVHACQRQILGSRIAAVLNGKMM